jgi:hypothetical protein
MVLTWNYGSGSVALAADYRMVDWSPSVAYADVTAGADTQTARIATIKDATASIELLVQTSGTQIAAALQPGQAGTLVIQPEGTATNKRKITFPAYADGAKVTFPYADVAVISCSFSGAGSALTAWTDGVN